MKGSQAIALVAASDFERFRVRDRRERAHWGVRFAYRNVQVRQRETVDAAVRQLLAQTEAARRELERALGVEHSALRQGLWAEQQVFEQYMLEILGSKEINDAAKTAARMTKTVTPVLEWPLFDTSEPQVVRNELRGVTDADAATIVAKVDLLLDHGPLELGNDPEHLEHSRAGRRLQRAQKAAPFVHQKHEVKVSALLKKGSVFLGALCFIALASWIATGIQIVSPYLAVLTLGATPFVYLMGRKLEDEDDRRPVDDS